VDEIRPPLASLPLGRGGEITAVCLLKQRIFEEWTRESSDEYDGDTLI
jgi:hypothetical protein